MQIFAFRWGRSETFCSKHRSQSAGRQLLVHRDFSTTFVSQGNAGSDVFAGRRGSTEYIEASSLVISDLHRAFMTIVLECFDITLWQTTKVLALSCSVCSIFPAPRLYKLCYHLSAALRGQVAGGGVPGVATLAPGPRHRPSALAQRSPPPAKRLGSAENNKDSLPDL